MQNDKSEQLRNAPGGRSLRRLIQFFFRPSLIGPRVSTEPLARTARRFAFVCLSIWAFLVVVCTWNTLPSPVWISASYLGQWRDAWREAFRPDIALSMSLLFLATVCGCMAFCLLATWLSFPETYRAGPVRMAFARSLRVATAGLWLLQTLGLVCTAVCIITLLPENERNAEGRAVANTLVAAVLSFGALVHWFARAVRSIPNLPPDLTPVCEGCGYDLSHEPAAGLCPECGLALESSLVDGRRRGASPWENRPGPLPWFATTAAIVFQPAAFYSRLRLRTPLEPARRFAVSQYLVIGAGAALWVFAVLVRLFDTFPVDDVFTPWLFFSMYGVAVVMVAWLLKRGVAAVAASVWFAAGWLRDGRWAAKVVAYETAFLWVYCAFSGLFFTSFAVFGAKWFNRLEVLTLGHRVHLFGIPTEILLFWLANLALIALWLVRYRTILRAIQWSNF